MKDIVPKVYQNNIGLCNQNQFIATGMSRKINRLADKLTSPKKKYGFKKNTIIGLSMYEKYELIQKIKK